MATTIGAATATEGLVSTVSFARNFQSVPVALIGISFSLAAFPALSTAYAAWDRRAFVRVLAANFVSITLFTALAAVGLMLVGRLAISVLLGGGEFDEEDVEIG